MMVGNFGSMKEHYLYVLLPKKSCQFPLLNSFFLITLFSSVEN